MRRWDQNGSRWDQNGSVGSEWVGEIRMGRWDQNGSVGSEWVAVGSEWVAVGSESVCGIRISLDRESRNMFVELFCHVR